MPAKIIDGVAVAAEIRSRSNPARRGSLRRAASPALGIMVGSNPASRVYVRNKIRACEEVENSSYRYDFAADADPAAVVERIAALNADPAVHGILVQLPLPPQFSIAKVLRTISAEKDVDGFHLYNVGGLVLGDTVFSPCTPYGVLKLLEHEGIPLEGANVVVVGASNIVGKPMALMLMQRDATVSSATPKRATSPDSRFLPTSSWWPRATQILSCRRWSRPERS